MNKPFVKMLRISSLLLLFFGGFAPDSIQATSVRVANLQNLIEQADRIFVGKCLSVESSETNNIPFTAYTFEVLWKIKGVNTDTVIVRQFGLTKPMAIGSGVARVMIIQGMPQYKQGQQYLLFLVRESAIGLSSPAGLFQGAFLSTRKGFVNSMNNRNLSRGLSASWLQAKGLSEQQVSHMIALKKGPIDAQLFLRILKNLSGEE